MSEQTPSQDRPRRGLPDFNRRSLLLTAAWIGGVLVFGFLIWFFTQSLRTRLLIERVNRELADRGESGRISQMLPRGRASGFGAWFSLVRNGSVSGNADRAFIFTLLRGSSTAACAALVDSSGTVEAILPLSENASQILGELPEPVYLFYIARIEKAARLRGGSN